MPPLRRPSAAFLLPALPPFPITHSLYFPYPPNNYNCNYNNSAVSLCCPAHQSSPWLARLPSQLAAAHPEVGPIQLPPSISSLIAADDSGALQTATSVLLTGAFALFLFRSLRRRAKRAKQMRFRSTGANKNFETASKPVSKAKARPSPDQALLGALIAAVFGVLLYKFTTTIEFSLNSQKLSNNYSVRQITITIRTIINGLCYLATFVFGFNSLGLLLYSGQLALDSFVEEGPSGKVNVPLNTPHKKSGDMEKSRTTSTGEEKPLDKTLEHKNEEEYK